MKAQKLVWMVLMLLIVSFAMSPIADAKAGGKVQLKRNAHENGAGGPTSFGDGRTPAADACSGWCTCSYCECSGGLSCCVGGCEACWDYRDDQGYCNQT